MHDSSRSKKQDIRSKNTGANGYLPNESHSGNSTLLLAILALGVVYGDIGTSPLYAIKECFHGPHGIELNAPNVLGVLSLIFWSLTVVISIKYLSFIMKADNHGEGGMFALLALIQKNIENLPKKSKSAIFFIGLLGASLLYGDGIITPAISVLSAVEGLEVLNPSAAKFTVPVTCFILFLLFFMQSKGTDKVGKVFGPIMICWFITLAVLGLINIIRFPEVLAAINPFYALDFFIINSFHGFLVLGSVVLCITGGEALYADMGHFGRKPIRYSWFLFVFPALLLNYFGQGALLLHDPLAVENPFYSLVPKTMVIPMVILATSATIIASQALISGAFSLTRQAIQLGFFPRLRILHTSEMAEGQIYIPFINYMLMIGCISVVLNFKESSRLAAAYGIAVTADMIITSIVFFFVIRRVWKWPKRFAVPLVGFFLIFDILYFTSNLLKIFDGGWFPLALAIIILNFMLAWRDGRTIMAKKIRELNLPIYRASDGTPSIKQGTGQLFEPDFHLSNSWLPIELVTGELLSVTERVPGTAVFMSVSLKSIPPVMMHHIKHNHVLHQQVIILSIKSKNVPVVPFQDAIEITEVGYGFYQVIASYGFMQTPNVPAILQKASDEVLKIDFSDITYFLGRETLIATKKPVMMKWRKALFTFMSRNSQPATAYFNIPPDRVVEIGMQIEI